MSDDFTSIVAGMTGAQLIEALNGNSALTKQLIENLAANILTCVLGNNIKQIRLNEGKLEVSTDGINWVKVDNNVWGSITGDITSQADLVLLLNGKASTTDLANTNTVVNNIDGRVSGLTTSVNANTQAIQNNTTAIGALQTKQAKQVSSDTIVLLRIGSSGFMQYSTDGTTWQTVQSVAEIDWGAIGGELSNQVDLQEALSSKANISQVNSHINNTSNPHSVTKDQVGLGNVDNTSDASKPISTAQQAAFDDVNALISSLFEGKISTTEDIKAIEYISLANYNIALEEGTLSETTLYIVD